MSFHRFKIFRMGLDACAVCRRTRAEHIQPEPVPEPRAAACDCKPPVLLWGNCSLHGAPWK